MEEHHTQTHIDELTCLYCSTTKCYRQTLTPKDIGFYLDLNNEGILDSLDRRLRELSRLQL